MHRLTLLPVLAILVAAGCFKPPGDVLHLADGSIMEGNLLSISGGRVVFDSGTAEVAGTGRVWLSNGRTFSGSVGYSGDTFSAGSNSAPEDSVIMVIWNDTELETGTFPVDASAGWLDTGIMLQPGEMIDIKAEGTVITETGTSSPEGQKEFSSSVALAPGATSGQLVFMVGEDGGPVAAGSSWTGESPGTGTLRLAVNVPARGSLEPSGTYTVTVAAGTNGRLAGATALYPASR